MVFSRTQKFISAVLILTPLLGIPFSISIKKQRQLMESLCAKDYQYLETAKEAGDRSAILHAKKLVNDCQAKARNGIVYSSEVRKDLS